MKIHLFLLLVLLANISDAFEYDEKDLESEEALWSLYEKWRGHHTQSRSLEEKMKRFVVFKSNVLSIHAFNKLDEPYKLGLNQFSDLTTEEFDNLYTCTSPQHGQADNETDFTYEDVRSVPDSIDWRKKGAVTPVGNQIGCASCWAFSTVASVEGINFIRTKKLISLSQQELIDCEKQSHGCRGGYIESAFNFITNKGITTEKKYPYKAQDGKCNVREVKSPAVRINGHARVPANDEDALLKAVANQPVSAKIDSSSGRFWDYKEGIFTGKCGKTLGHAVTIVGYGTTREGMKYWLVKNSWGTGWGEKGYVRMLRDIDDEQGLCGIAMGATYPIKKSHHDSSIKDEL